MLTLSSINTDTHQSRHLSCHQIRTDRPSSWWQYNWMAAFSCTTNLRISLIQEPITRITTLILSFAKMALSLFDQVYWIQNCYHFKLNHHKYKEEAPQHRCSLPGDQNRPIIFIILVFNKGPDWLTQPTKSIVLAAIWISSTHWMIWQHSN